MFKPHDRIVVVKEIILTNYKNEEACVILVGSTGSITRIFQSVTSSPACEIQWDNKDFIAAEKLCYEGIVVYSPEHIAHYSDEMYKQIFPDWTNVNKPTRWENLE